MKFPACGVAPQGPPPPPSPRQVWSGMVRTGTLCVICSLSGTGFDTRYVAMSLSSMHLSCYIIFSLISVLLEIYRQRIRRSFHLSSYALYAAAGLTLPGADLSGIPVGPPPLPPLTLLVVCLFGGVVWYNSGRPLPARRALFRCSIFAHSPIHSILTSCGPCPQLSVPAEEIHSRSNLLSVKICFVELRRKRRVVLASDFFHRLLCPLGAMTLKPCPSSRRP